jgi:dienelactone hydrolase
MRLTGIRTASLGLILLQSACAGPVASSGVNDAGIREQSIVIPVTDAAGHVTDLQGRVCRPASDAPGRLVVINHGSPPDAASRPLMKLGRCDSEAAQWFLDRGYVVVFALRRGYGATGGDFAESYGQCDDADYVSAGIETARDINAIVIYATTLPYVQPDGVVVVGQSAGGWGTIAYDSLPHPKVAAFVVMAGGRGGHEHDRPNTNCHPERLAAAAGHYGATATTPMLWVYAANDSFFGPSIAQALYAAFTKAGGRAEFEQPGPYDDDGHNLFFGHGGSAIWGPIVERYLAQQLASAG